MKKHLYLLITLHLLLLPSIAVAEGDAALTEAEALLNLSSKSLEMTANEWKCSVTSKFVCTKNKCEKIQDADSYIQLDIKRKLYQRCDSKGCTNADVFIEKGGIYTHFLMHSPNIFKVRNDGSEFVDVATIFETALVSYGNCIPM